MPRAKHKYHFTYKTVNLINGKYYVGMHSTSNLEDGYLGSGLRLRRSIKKYGKDNFKIEILQFFESKEKLIEAEIEMITDDMLNDSLCMNLKLGGTGGATEETIKKWHDAMTKGLIEKWKDPQFKEEQIAIMKIRNKENYDNGISKWKPLNWTNKKHKEETKELISEKAKLLVGELNSQFGKCWIYNLILKENKTIKKEELEKYINCGWIKGRKIKF